MAMRGRSRGRSFLLALAVPAVWAASLGASTGAFAAGAYTVSPGDWVAAGYDFQMSTHAVNNAQFYFQKAVMTVVLGCSSSSTTWTLQIGMAQGPYTVAASNTNWVASDQQSSYLTFQGAAQIPAADHCPSGQHLQAVGSSLKFSATVTSPNDTKDQLQIRFHAWDAYAFTPSAGNIDCASAQQNPNNGAGQGVSACSAPWAYSPPKAAAAPYATAPPSTPNPTTSHVTVRHPQTPPPVTLRPAPAPSSARSTSSSAEPRTGSGTTAFNPGDSPPVTPLPSPRAAPVVIGSGGVPGPASLRLSSSMNWVLVVVVVLLLILVGVALVLTSRRQQRTDVPPIPPVGTHF